jgi:hypothetical protein
MASAGTIEIDACSGDEAEWEVGGTSAVDVSALEGAKENIQPLRRGRDPTRLLKAVALHTATATATPSKAAAVPVTSDSKGKGAVADSSSGAPVVAESAKATIDRERQSLEDAIKTYRGEDPLSPWYGGAHHTATHSASMRLGHQR